MIIKNGEKMLILLVFLLIPIIYASAESDVKDCANNRCIVEVAMQYSNKSLCENLKDDLLVRRCSRDVDAKIIASIPETQKTIKQVSKPFNLLNFLIPKGSTTQKVESPEQITTQEKVETPEDITTQKVETPGKVSKPFNLLIPGGILLVVAILTVLSFYFKDRIQLFTPKKTLFKSQLNYLESLAPTPNVVKEVKEEDFAFKIHIKNYIKTAFFNLS